MAATDILLDKSGDLFISKDGDIAIGQSVAQKIRIKVLWFAAEWKWDDEEGLPYIEQLFVKNPDTDGFESAIREKIFEVEEVTNVGEISVEADAKTRKATIRFTAYTDNKTIKEEVIV